MLRTTMSHPSRHIFVATAAMLGQLAHAQVGTASWTWEASADGGQTWHSGLLEVPPRQSFVDIRGVASWDLAAGYAFKGVNFDGIWEAQASGIADEIVGPERYAPYFWTDPAIYVASKFGLVTKIDDTRDTAPPGQGARWIVPFQYAETVGDDFTTENPVWVFRYVVFLDGTPGDRTAHGLFRIPTGRPSDQFMAIYTSFVGGTNYPQTTQFPVTVRVLACPADFNRDGAGDFFDYLDFVAAFAADDPSADVNTDGQIDFFDYLDFVMAFDEGCE
jgi:hypothetical protein